MNGRNWILRGSLCLTVTAAAWSAPAVAQAAPGSESIEGTIQIFGCDVSADQIMVRARPSREPQGPGAATRVLRASPGDVAGVFTFRFDDLEEGIPYRIGVKFLGPAIRRCSQFAWSVDRDPLVLGGDSPLHFRSYAVRSKLEVLATTEGRVDPSDLEGDPQIRVPPELWVGADTLDFRDASKAVRRFRWKSDLPGVTGGQLQISLKPFPRIQERAYDPCRLTTEGGVLQVIDFDAPPGSWSSPPPVDFHALLLTPSVLGRLVDERTLTKLDLGLPLYVRVVPRIADKLLCAPEGGGTPPEVVLAQAKPFIPPPPPPPPDPKLKLGKAFYTPPVIGKQPFPQEVCYRFTKPHTLPCSFTIPCHLSWDTYALWYTKSEDFVGNTIREGASFCVPAPSSDDSWFDSVVDSFGSVLSAVVDGIGKLVNYASNLWEQIQDEAVDAVAHAVDDLGIINCDPNSQCRAALETGLEIALASMGVPPSIPNFEELTDMGVDYVAAQIASEAGIPEVVSDYASDQAQAFVKKAVTEMKTSYAIPGLPDWLVPDLHFEHAFLTMELFGRGLDLPYGSRPRMIRDLSPIYAGAMVVLPQRLPSLDQAPILFPMVLPPNLEDLPDPPSNYDDYQKARVDKNNWVKLRYTGGCYHLFLIGLSDPGGVTNLLDASFLADQIPIVPCTP